MSPNLSLLHGGKKFLWDGSLYPTREEADAVRASYHKDNFETHLVEGEGKFLVYSRRAVKEVVVTAQ